MEKINIVLVGMAGCGKSTIGVLLAKRLGMNFIDTDLLIQQKDGRLLQEIINSDGNEKFIQIENNILKELKTSNTVIATGGSAVYSEEGMSILKQNSCCVYLELSISELTKRIHNIETRGIVMQGGNTLDDVLNERQPLYEKYCDIKINCNSKSIEDCVENIALSYLNW